MICFLQKLSKLIENFNPHSIHLLKKSQNNVETKTQKDKLFSTIKSLSDLKNSEKVLRKLKKLNLSVHSLEKIIKDPIAEENTEKNEPVK